MPELGDRTSGKSLGHSGGSYYWVDCPDKDSSECAGERWSRLQPCVIAARSSDPYRYRTCHSCSGVRRYQGRPVQAEGPACPDRRLCQTRRQLPVVVLTSACHRCHGALASEMDELVCLQCGGRYYPRRELPELRPREPEPEPTPDAPRRRSRRARWQEIGAEQRRRAEQKWWGRNAEIVRRLDAGESVKDIAQALGRNERHIRKVREELRDQRELAAARQSEDSPSGVDVQQVGRAVTPLSERVRRANHQAQYSRNYRQSNADKIRARRQRYYQAHADERKEYSRAYHQAHVEERRAYYQAHREHKLEYERVRRERRRDLRLEQQFSEVKAS